MSQSLIFVGPDADAVIMSGLVHSGKCIFTASDKLTFKVYRGSKGVTGLRVYINREKKDDEAKPNS